SLAVPAHCHIRRLSGLDAMDHVQHDHPIFDGHLVLAEFASGCVSAPYAHGCWRRGGCGLGHDLSSMMALNSSGISGSGSGEHTSLPPSRRVATWTRPSAASVFG